MAISTATLRHDRRVHALEVMGEVLLGWGALSSLLWVWADVIAAYRYPGYSLASQTIGELSAVGAPTEPLVVALALAYGVLVSGFGVAVWECARGKRSLRVTGALVIAYGVAGFVAPFFPTHPRGSPTSFTDAAHVALAGAIFLIVLLQLAFGSGASGAAFRVYSLSTLAVVVVLGVVAGCCGLGFAAGAATPWVGVAQRACVGAYLLWVTVLDAVLLKAELEAAVASR
jgi:hypothetical protein